MQTVLLVRAELPTRTAGYLPMGALTLAEYLLEHGVSVRILDTQVDPWRKMLPAYLDGVTHVGISSLSGPQLAIGRDVALAVRRMAPAVRIAWGGVHASLAPETLTPDVADAIISGEGERLLYEWVTWPEENYLLHSFWRAESKAFRDLDTIGPLPYHLLPLERYGVEEWFPYHSSRGCPHNCAFCTNLAYHRRTWRPQSAGVVIDNLAHIVDEYNPKRVYFTDDEFFVNPERAERIANELHSRWPWLEWRASARCDYLQRREPRYWRGMRHAGCVQLGVGAESGSARQLLWIDKGITVDKMLEGIRNATNAGIRLNPVSTIYGMPGDGMDSLLDTCDLIDRVRDSSKGLTTVNGMFGLTLYPGTRAAMEAEERGYFMPVTLAEWRRHRFGRVRDYPWVSAHYASRATTASAIVRFQYFERIGAVGKIRSPLIRWAVYLALWPWRVSAAIRWPRRWFGWGVEWRVWAWLRDIYLGGIV